MGGSKRANAYARFLNTPLAMSYKIRKKANVVLIIFLRITPPPLKKKAKQPCKVLQFSWDLALCLEKIKGRRCERHSHNASYAFIDHRKDRECLISPYLDGIWKRPGRWFSFPHCCGGLLALSSYDEGTGSPPCASPPTDPDKWWKSLRTRHSNPCLPIWTKPRQEAGFEKMGATQFL